MITTVLPSSLDLFLSFPRVLFRLSSCQQAMTFPITYCQSTRLHTDADPSAMGSRQPSETGSGSIDSIATAENSSRAKKEHLNTKSVARRREARRRHFFSLPSFYFCPPRFMCGVHLHRCASPADPVDDRRSVGQATLASLRASSLPTCRIPIVFGERTGK